MTYRLSALLLLALAACSRSGLRTPLARVDAAVDAGIDASVDTPPVCIQAPIRGEPIRADLTLPVQLSVVDVFFLIDASGSMADEIDNVRRRLRDFVVPSVRARIPGAAFGLGYLGEFPVAPHGRRTKPRPYELRVPITLNALRLEGELDLAPDWSNEDFPEAQIEALYQVATGEGLPPFIDASLGCASGGEGGACFRDSALPVVMLFTDAPFHNGPPNVEPVAPYSFEPRPHSYQQAVDALKARDILVMGLGASDSFGPSPLPHLTALARDTGTVDSDGRALVFDIGDSGSSVGDTIVTAIERLAEGFPLDVDAFIRDGVGDDIDARDLIVSITPLSADPTDGVGRITDRAFVGTRPGTRVTFRLQINVASLPPATMARRVPATVVFRAAGRSIIGEQEIEILIPGNDGETCDAGAP